MHLALNYTQYNLLTPDKGDRSNADNVLVVLTDGGVQHPFETLSTIDRLSLIWVLLTFLITVFVRCPSVPCPDLNGPSRSLDLLEKQCYRDTMSKITIAYIYTYELTNCTNKHQSKQLHVYYNTR